MSSRTHWQQVYEQRKPPELSWWEPTPQASLDLIKNTSLASDAAILDVGGGASKLAGELLNHGYSDITVADLASKAMEEAQAELGERAEAIRWVETDVSNHDFGRQYDLWHDRAFFHFLVTAEDRHAYVAALRRALRPGGHVIVATFGPDGPTKCSGLPVARYGPDDLAEVLGDGFEPLSGRLTMHNTPSGTRQQFLYAHLRRKRSQ
jgi:2-polyprenyl-3-methyl-5-hydroxy-6-metoxy-1,4-benzoquinol methylase